MDMMDFEERLAAAKQKPRPHRDVTVLIDVDAAQQRDELLEALRNAQARDESDQRLAGPTDTEAAPYQEALDALDEAARKSMVTLRFYRIPGNQWAALTALHPLRLDAPIDREYGYNLDAACQAAAAFTSTDGTAYGFRVHEDDEIRLAPEQWTTLFDVVSGSEVSAIRDAIWALNEYEPGQRIEALVKGFGAASRSDTK